MQQSVTGLPCHNGIRPGLLRQRFTQQPEEKTESMLIEFAKIGKPRGLTGRKPSTRGFDLQRFLGQFERQPRASVGAIAYAKRSLRPLRRSLIAAVAPSNCGIDDLALALSNSA